MRPHASVRGDCHTPASSFREGGLSYPRTKQVAFLMISSSIIAVTCPWVRFFPWSAPINSLFFPLVLFSCCRQRAMTIQPTATSPCSYRHMAASTFLPSPTPLPTHWPTPQNYRPRHCPALLHAKKKKTKKAAATAPEPSLKKNIATATVPPQAPLKKRSPLYRPAGTVKGWAARLGTTEEQHRRPPTCEGVCATSCLGKGRGGLPRRHFCIWGQHKWCATPDQA